MMDIFLFQLLFVFRRRRPEQEKVTQEDIAEIHNRFAVLDADNNGFITEKEIGTERDRDGDGFIDLHELDVPEP